MPTDQNVDLSLPVDEAILLCSLARRWEVEHRLAFDNVAEYFALHNLSGRLSSQEAVAKVLWSQDDIPQGQAIPRAADAAAARVISTLREQNWPAEWFEQYPPRAFTTIDAGYTVNIAPNAGMSDFALMLAQMIQNLSKQLALSSSEDIESVQKQLVLAVLQRLGMNV